jgi:iron complex transport system ATP-binding protein
MELIKLDGISVVRNKNPILTDIDWTMQDGENWAVIGENGAGKSFLLRLLSAQMFPSSGKVKVFGEEFGKVDMWELRKKIGLVSDSLQKRQHDHTKVLDVALSGFFSSVGVYNTVNSDMEKSALKQLKFMGVDRFKERNFSELSTGEQRRVLIARALVFDPKLLILDEPCTGLDIPAREKFLNNIGELIKKGHNIVFVTHHIEEVIPTINKVLLMKNGRILAAGDKEKVMTEENLRKALGYEFELVEKNGRYWSKVF